MSFSPELMALFVSQMNAGRRDREDEEERRRARRDSGFQFGLNLATQADGFDVKKAAPFLTQEFGVDANQLAFLEQMQKQRAATLKAQEQEAAVAAETAAQAGFGQSVLTDPQLAPELDISQVLASLRDVERAGLLQDQQLGTTGGAEQALANVDIARTKAQITQREAKRASLDAEFKALRDRQWKDEGQLRDELMRNSTPWINVKAAADSVKAASASKDRAGDLAMLYGFMNVIAPGNRITDADFENAAEIGGLPGQAQAWYSRLTADGGWFTLENRAQLLRATNAQLKARESEQKQRQKMYRTIAKKRGLDAESAVPDLTARDMESPPPEEPQARFIGVAPDTGNPLFQRPDGTQFENVP